MGQKSDNVLLRGQGRPEHRIDRIEVHRQGHEAPVFEDGTDPVDIRDPLAKAAQPIHDTRVLGVEEVGPVAVHPDAVLIHEVESVAGDVVALVDDVDFIAGLGQLPGVNGSRETRADHENGVLFGNRHSTTPLDRHTERSKAAV